MELIFKMTNRGIFLNRETMVPYSQTNLPKSTFSFTDRQPILWLVELTGVDGPFYVVVKNYCFEDIHLFENQRVGLNITRLIFEDLNWNALEPQLTSYQKSAFVNVAKNLQSKFRGWAEPGFGTGLGKQTDTNRQNPSAPETPKFTEPASHDSGLLKSDTNRIFEIRLTVPVTEVSFENGYASFRQKVREINTLVDFRIDNEYILKEYDTVKNWFARKLGANIQVQATLKLENGIITVNEVSSQEIQAINPDFIEKVKEYRTLQLIKATLQIDDQVLFTADDVFSTLSPEEEGNIFSQSDAQLVSILMQKVAVRSRVQLNLLSKYHLEDIKLRFTLKPSFGFVFTISCKGFNHFIWELLETHATYIWSIPEHSGEVDQQYEQIERIISEINKAGRQKYRRQVKNGAPDGNAVFHFIEHPEDGGFTYWKKHLESVLGVPLIIS